MCSKIISEAHSFSKFLRTFQDESQDSSVYEEEIQVLKFHGDKSPLQNIYSSDRPVFICEKKVPKIAETYEEEEQETECDDEDHESIPDLGPQPLTIMKARQLLSWYTMSQNTSVYPGANPGLNPLWVRCDMADPARTTWLGAETVYSSNKISGVKLYSVTCKDATAKKASFITLDELKQEHKNRHRSSLSSMVTKGTSQYTLFRSTVENTTVESQSSVTVDFKWNHVENILENPPLSSLATLNIKVLSGDVRSQVFEMHRELEFLKDLAEGQRTGETEWREALETRPAVELIKEYLEGLQNTVKTLQDSAGLKEAPKVKSDPEESKTDNFLSLIERGDLDFVEQLWVRMSKSVTSYQDIGDCLKMVIKALQYGDIKPWIHRDSSSSLSKLILQSYHGQMDPVALTGLAPVHMLLEMGLGKMRKDYTYHLMGKELTTLNHLSYYLSTEVDLQEQVLRVRKLHHLLEIIVTCSTSLGLPYDRLFLLTQSILKYYKTFPYDESHEFKLQIKPALISQFHHDDQPMAWGVEVSSGQGPREVKTSWKLSENPLVDHIIFNPGDTTVNVDVEEAAYFPTMVCCSLVSFT